MRRDNKLQTLDEGRRDFRLHVSLEHGERDGEYASPLVTPDKGSCHSFEGSADDPHRLSEREAGRKAHSCLGELSALDALDNLYLFVRHLPEDPDDPSDASQLPLPI